MTWLHWVCFVGGFMTGAIAASLVCGALAKQIKVPW